MTTGIVWGQKLEFSRYVRYWKESVDSSEEFCSKQILEMGCTKGDAPSTGELFFLIHKRWDSMLCAAENDQRSQNEFAKD